MTRQKLFGNIHTPPQNSPVRHCEYNTELTVQRNRDRQIKMG